MYVLTYVRSETIR